MIPGRAERPDNEGLRDTPPRLLLVVLVLILTTSERGVQTRPHLHLTVSPCACLRVRRTPSHPGLPCGLSAPERGVQPHT